MSTSATHYHPAFVAALEADREQINQLFRMTSMQGSPLDGEAFKDHLVERVEPIVAAVHACFPERTRTVTLALVNVSLELFRAGFWGKESRLAVLDQLWTEALPLLAKLIARDPERVTGSLSNAVINIAGHSLIGASRWVELWKVSSSQGILNHCHSTLELLDTGRVIAWLCGMAHLRSLALELLSKLPPALARSILGLSPDQDAAAEPAQKHVDAASDPQLEAILEQLSDDPWLDPLTASAAANELQVGPAENRAPRLIRTVGSFRGFGGEFIEPPTVTCENGQLLVHDGKAAWRLHADRFGSALQRMAEAATPAVPEKATGKRTATRSPKSTSSEWPRLSGAGQLQWNSHQASLACLSHASSQAFDGHTLAVTLPSSYRVYLIACCNDEAHAASRSEGN